MSSDEYIVALKYVLIPKNSVYGQGRNRLPPVRPRAVFQRHRLVAIDVRPVISACSIDVDKHIILKVYYWPDMCVPRVTEMKLRYVLVRCTRLVRVWKVVTLNFIIR